MSLRPAPAAPTATAKQPFYRLSQGQTIFHIGFAIVSAVCMTAAARPQNAYVGLRAGMAVYVWMLYSTLTYAHVERKTFYILAGLGLVALTQWFPWCILHQFGGSSVLLATFIRDLVYGWIVVMLVARVILPVAS